MKLLFSILHGAGIPVCKLCNIKLYSFLCAADESGSDEDFMVEDDDDSDYGHSKKRGKKVIRRGRPDKKEKKSPKPRLKATGEIFLIYKMVEKVETD